MKRTIISAMLLLWAGTCAAYTPLKGTATLEKQARMVVGMAQYERLCKAPVPSSLAAWIETTEMRIDPSLLKEKDAEVLASIDRMGTEVFCKGVSEMIKEFEAEE
jgi:hypothetical protein